MMASQMIFTHEKRPLKRPKLGPPDVYPQDPKQREDELTAVNVKQGFSHIPQLSDEFGTAKNCNISAAKLGAFMNGALSKKGEANTFPDTGKRRLQVNTKDHFWHVTHTPRHKQVLEAWMRDLAGGKPLSAIAKKVPIFNKREEIFLTLADHNVPLIRAGWFLKMTASYNSAISEAKTKKRQMPDPSQEWTISLARCCKDILMRVTDWYGGGTGSLPPANPSGVSNNPPGGSSSSNQGPSSSPSLGGSTPGHTSVNGPGSVPGANSGTTTNLPGATAVGGSLSDDGNLSLRQWLYCMDLAKYLYEEGLLDRYEWLIWVVDMCDKTKSLDDPGWKALLPVMLSYLPDIAQSELLARRLSTLSARKLSAIFTDQDFTPTGTDLIPPPSGLLERLKCPTHRATVLGLASVIQVALLECPTAMVYNANPMAPQSESGRNSVPGGSPLDILPIQPSVFPMPPRANNNLIRAQLRAAEEQVIARSRAVEAKWSCDEWQQSSAGSILQKVLSALDSLDRHCFDKIDSSNSLESLYSQIFTTPVVKDNPAEADAPIILLLCQWAVGPQRTGEHRALAVARLLEHRQSDVLSCSNDANEPSQRNNNNGGTKNNTSENGNGVIKTENSGGEDIPMLEPEVGNNNNPQINGISNNNVSTTNEVEEGEFPNGLPVYHNLLLRFLDSDAPTLDETSPQSKATFSALVNLFSALIRHDVFSHDAYLCTLVARGDLSSVSQTTSNNNMPPSSVQPIPSVATPGPASQAGPTTPASVSSITPSTTPHHDVIDDRGPLFPPLPRMPEMPRQTDFDDPNIDDDLDRILQHITQEQQNRDQVDSPKDDNGNSGAGGFGSITPNAHQQQAPLSNSTNSSDPNSNQGKGGSEISKQSRHRQYVTHFQLPQDDSFQHEANQRHILLYGVGRTRDEARHVVKKVSKELSKLFSKKFCYDIADGSRVKRHSKNEINFESLQTRFASLSYFDQHAVTSSIAQSAVEMISNFAAGRSNYLPTVEHFGYLTDLMEIGLNFTGLLETCCGMLRELDDIESTLCQRHSPIAGTYTTSLQLQLVAILRRYHNCLLLDSEMTMTVWESLIRLMKRFNSAYECSSAERCALAYVTELQSCCGFLRSKNLSEFLSKLRQSLCTDVRPVEMPQNWNKSFMTQCLDYPKRKVEMPVLRQLIENPGCRYSFVCNAILSICNEADAEQINDLASLCAEMTAACPSLAPEWLSVLQTLCSPSRDCVSYSEILSAVDVKHLSIHSSLATLTALLVARQCFSLEDFVKQAVFSLLKAWNEGRGPHDPDTEAGARLTCQLLLSLFKTQDPGSISGTNILKLSCDRRLLSASHNSITLGAVCAALKALLLLTDAAGSGERRREQRTLPGISHGELSISHILGTSDAPASDRNDVMRGEPRTLASFGYSALQQMCAEPWVLQTCLQNADYLWNTETFLDPMVSSKQAQRLLHLICYPDIPLSEEGLDPKVHIPRLMDSLDQWNLREALLALTLQHRQLATNSPMEHGNWLDIVARSALDVFHLGTEDGQDYVLPNSAAPSPAPGKSPRSGKKTQQISSQDIIAKTPPSNLAITNNPLSSSSSSSFGGSSNGPGNMGSGNESYRNTQEHANNEGPNNKRNNADPGLYGWTPSAAWLLAPLVTKLSPAVQGRVLRHAGNVLESKHHFKKKPSTSINGGTGTSSLQAHLPFLALILTCLRGQDEQREGLLASLLTQFTQILSFVKLPDIDAESEAVRDLLRLRLSLVGGMFDAIQRSPTATAEWAVVLTQLVTTGVVDLYNNLDILPTVIDMVTALVHSTQIAEPGERIEEMKRHNMNLIKKLKKELSEKDSECIKPLRQLLPFSKVQVDIIVTQATSMIIDSKGNRVQSFEFVDKKPGLQVWEKQRVSPWDIIEGQKNPAQLSWGWFGAVKMERKPLRYEDAHRLLKFHTHDIVKPNSHFLEPVPLPQEDVDMKPEIIVKEEILIKPDTPLSDQSPRGIIAAPGRKPKAPRKRRQTKAQVAAAAAVVQPPPPINSPSIQPPPVPVMAPVPVANSFGTGVVQTPMPPGPNPPPPSYAPGANSQWFNGNPPQQQQQQQQQQQPPPQQQQFYPQGPGGAGPGRPPLNQSKQVLQNILRARHHAAGPPPAATNQFQQFHPGPAAGPPGGPRPGPQNILRQQLRGQTHMQNQNFQAQSAMQPNQSMMYQQQQQPMQTQQGMTQSYTYNQPGMNTQGQPVSGPPGSTLMNQQQQPPMNTMIGQRGPGANQEMTNFMQGGPGQGPGGQVRPQSMVGQRAPGFMQGNPQGSQVGMNPMQGGYARPQMGQPGGQMVQQGPGGQIVQPNPGQMVQQSSQGQMIQQGQMGMSNASQMGQMGQPGIQNTSGMTQGLGMQHQGMVPPSQMGQAGMVNPGQTMQGQMGQTVMQNPNMANAQRMRQFVAMQQQQQQQQQQGMGMGQRMQYQNQPGGY